MTFLFFVLKIALLVGVIMIFLKKKSAGSIVMMIGQIVVVLSGLNNYIIRGLINFVDYELASIFYKINNGIYFIGMLAFAIGIIVFAVNLKKQNKEIAN